MAILDRKKEFDELKFADFNNIKTHKADKLDSPKRSKSSKKWLF